MKTLDFRGWPGSAGELSRCVYASPDPSRSALEMMMVLEASGRHLYERLAKALDVPEAAALILKNAREEWGHAHRLAKALRILSGVRVAVPTSEQNPFCEARDFSGVNATTLRAMAASELRGEALYTCWSAATDDAEVSRLLRLNAREEREHAARLKLAASMLEAV